MSYVERAEAYVSAVLGGEIPSCRWVRLACERHRRDREREGTDAFPYVLDEKRATKACAFLELLPHVKGEWAREKETFELQPWQCFNTVSVFGWVHQDTGLRRFRKVSIYVPRKNGKSFWTAGVGNYMAWVDGEEGAEVYSGAATEKQAWEVFGPARLMVRNTPTLQQAASIEVGAKALYRTRDYSKFEPVIGKPGDGAAPHCAIVDEYHEHPDSSQYDTMLTGMGSRSQPLMLVISTAGDDIEGPCYDDFRTVQRILEEAVTDEEHFGVIWCADAEDDWTDPAVLEKANPNIGVSVKREFLLARQREAVENARHQYRFKIKHLNLWVSSRSAFYNVEEWRGLGDRSITLESMSGHPCFVGLDLASKVDIAAVCFLFPDGEEFRAVFRLYCPESRIEEPESERYRAWAAEGALVLTDGDMIDLQRIQDDLSEIAGQVEIRSVAHDPWQAAQLAGNLQGQGLDLVEWRQTVQMMSEPMKESEALIKAGRLHHDGNPAVTWMMGNVVAKIDAKENVYPRKEREQDKIDGPVALITALGCALHAAEVAAPSISIIPDGSAQEGTWW